MRRSLGSHVGRPCNKVHQELCEHVSFDSAVQGHVLSDIHEFEQMSVQVDERGGVFQSRFLIWPSELAEGTVYVSPIPEF